MIPGSKQFENEIISGALSADMMDYLLRDGYFTGAEHAKIDHNRITNSFEIYKNKLALQSSALVNFETMMISRFRCSRPYTSTRQYAQVK